MPCSINKLKSHVLEKRTFSRKRWGAWTQTSDLPKYDNDDNAKIKVSTNIPCTLLLFKGSTFLQIFFPIKSKFREGQIFLTGNVLDNTYLFL